MNQLTEILEMCVLCYYKQSNCCRIPKQCRSDVEDDRKRCRVKNHVDDDNPSKSEYKKISTVKCLEYFT